MITLKIFVLQLIVDRNFSNMLKVVLCKSDFFLIEGMQQLNIHIKKKILETLPHTTYKN